MFHKIARTLPKLSRSEQIRFLSLQEHVSQSILNEHGITTPKFRVAKTGKEAEEVAKDLLTKNLVVKAQVLSGGRSLGRFDTGLQGGVHMAISPDEVKEIANKMIGNKLITQQTANEGKICNSVIVAERKFARREFYFAFAMDRELGPVLLASSRGGVNIEDIARYSPELLIKEPVDIEKGLTKEMANWILRRVGICDQQAPASQMLRHLYELFVKRDCLLAEINPYVEDVCLNYYALDAKLTFDDNAAFRQKDTFGKCDESQEEPKELAASKIGMSYIALDGSIGCLVNGAGLAMATADILKYYNGKPANFLDIGSMASNESIKEAIKIIMTDNSVRTIFVNIFGGMMKCDDVSDGLLKTIRELDLKIPVVLRIHGNNEEKARKIIKDANTSVITCNNFEEAAEKAVRCARIMKIADGGNLNAHLSMNVKCDCEQFLKSNDPTMFYPPLSIDDSSGKDDGGLNMI